MIEKMKASQSENQRTLAFLTEDRKANVTKIELKRHRSAK